MMTRGKGTRAGGPVHASRPGPAPPHTCGEGEGASTPPSDAFKRRVNLPPPPPRAPAREAIRTKSTWLHVKKVLAHS